MPTNDNFNYSSTVSDHRSPFLIKTVTIEEERPLCQNSNEAKFAYRTQVVKLSPWMSNLHRPRRNQAMGQKTFIKYQKSSGHLYNARLDCTWRRRQRTFIKVQFTFNLWNDPKWQIWTQAPSKSSSGACYDCTNMLRSANTDWQAAGTHLQACVPSLDEAHVVHLAHDFSVMLAVDESFAACSTTSSQLHKCKSFVCFAGIESKLSWSGARIFDMPLWSFAIMVIWIEQTTALGSKSDFMVPSYHYLNLLKSNVILLWASVWA